MANSESKNLIDKESDATEAFSKHRIFCRTAVLREAEHLSDKTKRLSWTWQEEQLSYMVFLLKLGKG